MDDFLRKTWNTSETQGSFSEKPSVIIGLNGGLKNVFNKVHIVATTDMPVLLLGATGSGKEVIARSIHENSKRCKNEFIRVNCGAISPQLIDSELFGHERGSFTGAISSRKGWFERANHGTLFLDEIGEMPEAVQIRLLRVLQDGIMERIGSEKSFMVDVRIIAATHRNLAEMVQTSQFRKDLWFRISSFPIEVPSLKDRTMDIPDLAKYFIHRSAFKFGIRAPEISAEDIEKLKNYDWPGNVRELEAILARAVLLAQNGLIDIGTALGTTLSTETTSFINPTTKMLSLESLNKHHIESILAKTLGRIEGPFGAAKILQVHPNTLRSRMKKLGIDWRHFKKTA